MSQTTVQNSNCLRFGSGKLEVDAYGSAFGSLQDLGALRDLKITESWDPVQIDSNNAGQRIISRIKNQKITVEAIWLEPDFAKLDVLRGGSLDNYAAVAGDPVEDHDQYVASGDWEYSKFIPFDAQQATGVVPTNIGVSGSVDGPLVADTDFFVMENAAGIWGFYVIDSATVTTESQVLTAEYDYTPAASKTFSSGGGRTVDEIEVQITNTNEDDADWRIRIYKATITKGIEFNMMSDDADDVNQVPIMIEGVCDPTRSATNRDQLYAIVDEQGV
jgi:hypothetical protein